MALWKTSKNEDDNRISCSSIAVQYDYKRTTTYFEMKRLVLLFKCGCGSAVSSPVRSAPPKQFLPETHQPTPQL
jgi:hypothetical protein